MSDIIKRVGFIKPENNNPYNGEPAIVDGDLEKSGGDYKRNYGIDNMIYILTGTNAGYWGNLIAKDGAKIQGGIEELDSEPITSDFLKRYSAKIEYLLTPFIKNKIAESIKVESFNPSSDRIDWIAEIKMADGTNYLFNSHTGGEIVS